MEPAGPRIGLSGAWFDPTDPGVWSGVPHNLVAGLERLGVYAGYRSATPWVPAARLIHRAMVRTGRMSGSWPLSPAMLLLSDLTEAALRATQSDDVDGWVLLACNARRPVRGRVVTLSEMSPSQLEGTGPAMAASLGLPDVTPRRLRAVARRQAAGHRRADACCVASRWAGESLVRHHGVDPARVHVVGYGRNVELEAPPARDWSTPRFLFVGRDWRRKNGDAVVRGFSAVRRRVPGATLDVVGRHPRLDAEGVTGHGELFVHEPAGRARLAGLFARATCFVMPSLFEPFGIVYAEAGAAGVASIATRVGGTADSVGRGGILVDPADDGQIEAAMLRMCDPATAAAYGAAAADHARLLTWDAFAERVLRAFGVESVGGRPLAPFL